MNPADDRVVELFSAAVDLPAAERDAFLERECGNDHALIREVRDLLGADERPGDFLDEKQLVGVLPDIERLYGAGRDAQSSPIPETPESIGPFKVTRLLGEGGMGLVFEARQDNPERRIAIKVVRPDSLTEEVIVRFRNEAEFLSRLRHPAIPQVYQSGVFELGDQRVPYLAMELVEGTELLAWIAETEPSTEARLELIIQIADAVREAHEHGIIHRDLKPTNILVGADGRAKVLDFGIARVIDPDASVHGPTSAHQVLGTLAYMSPEQLDGDVHRLSFATDVYALGVIAFEMLTGELPFDIRGRPYTEVVRIINTHNPRSLARHDATLKGELDLIVAKALAQDLEHRYSSARYLADDLRRFLRHEPVDARRPSSLYHLRKFARRRPLLASLSGILVLLLIASSVLLSVALNAAQDAARSAQLRERQARWQIYRSEVQQAGRRIDDDPIAVARHLAIARDQGTQLGWEWHHLQTRLGSPHVDVELGEETRGSIGFDSAGRRLAVGLASGALAVVDTTAATVTRVPLPEVHVTTARFSDNANEVIVGTDRGEVLTVSVVDRKVLRRTTPLPGHAIEGVVRHGPSGMLFAWAHGISRLERRGHPAVDPAQSVGYVVDAAVDPSGSRLAVAGSEGWKVVALPSLSVISESTRTAWSVAFDPTTNAVLVGTEFDGIVTVSDEGTQGSIDAGTKTVSHVWPVGDGTLLVIENHRVFRLLDAATGAVRASWPVGDARARVLAGSRTERRVAVARAHRTSIYLRPLPSLDRRVLARHATFVYDVTVDPTGRLAASIDFGGEVRLTDTLTRREVFRWHAPDKRFVRFGSQSRKLYLYSHRTFADVLEVEVVDLLTRQRTLHSLADDGFAALLSALEEPDGSHVLPSGVGVHPDRNLFVAPYDEDAYAVQRVEDLSPHHISDRGVRLARAPALVERIRFNRGGDLFATAAWDGTACLWNASTLERVAIINVEGGRPEITDPAHRVYDVLFTPDDRRLLTASRDGILRGWSVESPELVVQLAAHASYIHALAASPRGDVIVSASGDGTVRGWPSAPPPLVEDVRQRVDAALPIGAPDHDYEEALRDIEARLPDREQDRLDARGEFLVRALSAWDSIRLVPGLLDLGAVAPFEATSIDATLHNDASFPIGLLELVVESSDASVPVTARLEGPPPGTVVAPGGHVGVRIHLEARGPGSWEGRVRCRHGLGERTFAARARVAERGPRPATEHALAFDGVGTGVELPAIPLPDEFTWEFWLRDRGGETEQTLLTSTQLVFEGVRTDFSVTRSTPYERITVCIGSVKRSFPFDPSWTWTHLAITCRRPENGTGLFASIYRNARFVGEFPVPGSWTPGRTRRWVLGQGRDQGRASKHYLGDLGRVRLWSKALPRDEVYRAMTTSSRSLDKPAIVAAWDFGGTDDVIRDVSGHGRDASLAGPHAPRVRRIETAAPTRVLVMNPIRNRVQLPPLSMEKALYADLWFRPDAGTGALPLLEARTATVPIFRLGLRDEEFVLTTPDTETVMPPPGERRRAWHHLLVMLRRSADGGAQVDVILDGQSLASNVRVKLDPERKVHWALGSTSTTKAPAPEDRHVFVEDLRIWEDVAAAPADAGRRLRLWWDFEGLADDIRDASGNDRLGRFEGNEGPVRIVVH